MQEAQPGGAVHDLAHYTRPLRRHKPFIAVCIVLGVALGVVGSMKLHSSYTSSAHVLVLTDITDQGTGNVVNGRTSGAVNLDTEAQLLKSEPMAATVKALLHSSASTRKIAAGLTVTVPANTTVLDLTYKARTASAAEAGAQAYATAYLSNRAALARQTLNLQITSINTQVAAANAKLQQATKTYANAPNGSATQQFAKQEIQYRSAQLENLNEELDALNTPIVPGRVISPASPAVKSTLKRDILVFSGLLLGILVGVLGAWERDRIARTIRSNDDLEQIGIEVIGPGPRRSRSSKRGRQPGVGGPEHEAAAVIASRIDPGRAIYIAGVSSNTAASRVGARIAGELQRFGATVRIIQLAPNSADPTETAFLRRPPAGAEPGSFGSPAGLHAVGLKAQIAAGRDRDDYVLLIGGDAERDAEGYLAAASADATLLVVEAGVTTRQALRAVAHEVGLAPTTLLGAVIVTPERGPAPSTAGFTGSTGPGVDSRHDAQREGGSTPINAAARVFDRPPVRQE